MLLLVDREDGYFYYTRTLEGKQYSVHARRRVPDSLGAPTGKDHTTGPLEQRPQQGPP